MYCRLKKNALKTKWKRIEKKGHEEEEKNQESDL
jgi:hypothetical protein